MTSPSMGEKAVKDRLLISISESDNEPNMKGNQFGN